MAYFKGLIELLLGLAPEPLDELQSFVDQFAGQFGQQVVLKEACAEGWMERVAVVP